MTATSLTRPGADGVAEAAGGAIGILGEQGGEAGVDVGEVDAGVGADEAVPGLADDEIATAPQDPHRLAGDDVAVAPRVVGIDRHQAALGLRHDLLGHDDDVAVAQRGRRVGRRGVDDHRGEVVSRSDLGDAIDAEDLEPPHHIAQPRPVWRAPARRRPPRRA